MDTTLAIEHTCNSLIDVYTYLLSRVFNFVMLDEFTTDNIKSEFRKLKWISGIAYFIAVQNVVEKFHIKKK